MFLYREGVLLQKGGVFYKRFALPTISILFMNFSKLIYNQFSEKGFHNARIFPCRRRNCVGRGQCQ